MSQTKKSHPFKVMHSFLWICLLLIAVITISNGCKNDEKTGEPTSDEKATTPDAPAGPNADFFQLRIDSATLVNTFYLTPPDERFKKLLLSFTMVKDFREFPDSLTLLAQGAKMNNDLYTPNCPSILLDVKDTTKVNLPKDVLFNTLELSFNKLRGIIGADGRGRRYNELIFIPFAKDSCGKRYLSYHVQCWPPIGGGAEPTEDVNPCPPQKPE